MARTLTVQAVSCGLLIYCVWLLLNLIAFNHHVLVLFYTFMRTTGQGIIYTVLLLHFVSPICKLFAFVSNLSAFVSQLDINYQHKVKSIV